MKKININAVLAIMAKQLATSNMCMVILAEMKAKSEEKEFDEVYKSLHDAVNKSSAEFVNVIKGEIGLELSSWTIEDLFE